MKLRRAWIAVVTLLLPAAAARTADPPLLGFTAAGAQAQRDLEKRLDAAVQPSNMKEWMRRLTARPHHVGSPHGEANARFIAEQFRSWGYETSIEEFQVLFPTPVTRLVEMVAPTRWTAALAEPALPEDATSGQAAEQLPVYNAYSRDGDVTGELVYVNYGVPRDYEELERRGIDVKGRIVIARYGGSWRGIKPKVAAEHGAIGCLIYSDPRDDGYFKGDAYPKGPWRPERGAQRGSVADSPLFPGDPLTPGVGATAGAKRLPIDEAPTLTRIPTLPLSWGDAAPLLRALGGPVAPEAWRGALPLTYHLGPGPARVRLKVAFDWKLRPARDVIARLPGGDRADEWIIRGNHHDAWVNGAHDPVSGLVAMMEEARVVASLARGGWRPRRTIVYAAWDAEEPMLLGSTEWVEAHAEELRRHAAVYINTDAYARGFLEADGSHTLERFINEVARAVEDPRKKVTLLERARASRVAWGTAEERREARDRADLRIGALGSGSDFTPFLQHLGVATLNIGFGGEYGEGAYHSVYDSFDHFTRFGDPGFAYGTALVRVNGRAVTRLASADVLPMHFGAAADAIALYADEVIKLADEMREQTEEGNRRVKDGTWEAVSDPDETFVVPSPRPPVPHLNFAPLRNAVSRLRESARGYDEAWSVRDDRPLAPAAQVELDRILIDAERALTRAEGLPGRPWYRHQVYAPGLYTGYGVKTLPAVREALEQRDWDLASEQVAVVARTLEGFAAHVDRATGVLRAP